MTTKALEGLGTETFIVTTFCIMQVCSHLLHAHRLVHVLFGVWDCRVSGACSHFPLRQYCQRQKDLYFLKGGTFCI